MYKRLKETYSNLPSIELFTQYDNLEYSDNLTKEDIKQIKLGQKKMTNMLRVFNKICKDNNIKYWCTQGTLLGVIRHKGWIPWDGDIDISMLEEDYNKLKIIIQDLLPKDMWFQNSETDKYYKASQAVEAKIRDLNSCYIEYTNNGGTSWHNGLQIDIFVYNKSSAAKHQPKDIIFPLKNMVFEDIKVYVPNNYEKYLNNTFGDNWIELLDKDERFPHEGKMDGENTCKFHYEKYPNIH